MPFMSRGSLGEAAKHNRLVTVALVCGIAICAVLLGIKDLSKPWTIGLQVASAVAGAALGNALRLDHSQGVVRNQARPAIRHLFDQVGRLRGLVQRAELYQAEVDSAATSSTRLDHARTSDWFGGLGQGLRDEINATAAAIENWGDLAPEVQEAELESYRTREQRLPAGQEREHDA